MKKFVALLGISLLALFAFAQTAPTVEETIAALEEGITNIPLDAAVANIEGWEAELGASDDAALQGIGEQLGQLREALSADEVDTAEVSGLLTSLGTDTAAAGADAGDDQLVMLGDMLSEAGAMLMGGDMTGGDMTGGVMTGGDMTGGMMTGGAMTGGGM